jgi:uncharacterized membrane protein
VLNNLAGWHLLIILGVLALVALAVIALIVVAIRIARRRSADDPTSRLTELDLLRTRGLVSDTEYEVKRQEILGRL